MQGCRQSGAAENDFGAGDTLFLYLYEISQTSYYIFSYSTVHDLKVYAAFLDKHIVGVSLCSFCVVEV